MKITTSLENIHSFGGLNFISTEFEQLPLPKLITSFLGKRSSLATYEYSDVIKNFWMILCSGGDCAEDIQTNLKSELSNVLNMKICSADTILDRIIHSEIRFELKGESMRKKMKNN